jgi:hypothetical protein
MSDDGEESTLGREPQPTIIELGKRLRRRLIGIRDGHAWLV